MFDISRLSRRYSVRLMSDSDANDMFEFCRQNTQYYQYCGRQPSLELVLSDLHITPPGIDPSDKYYIGFYQKDTLIALMDLIDGYPEPGTAYIGFFMVNKAYQGQQLGTSIIRDTAAYLKAAGKTAVRLGIDKGNPQSTHFWKKNGFFVIREVDRDGGTILVAERTL